MMGSKGSAKRSTRARRDSRSEEDSTEAAVVTAVEPTEDGRRVEIKVVEEAKYRPLRT